MHVVSCGTNSSIFASYFLCCAISRPLHKHHTLRDFLRRLFSCYRLCFRLLFSAISGCVLRLQQVPEADTTVSLLPNTFVLHPRATAAHATEPSVPLHSSGLATILGCWPRASLTVQRVFFSVHGGIANWTTGQNQQCSQPKMLGGDKYLNLSEQEYSVGNTASRRAKRQDMLDILGTMGSLDPSWLRLWMEHCCYKLVCSCENRKYKQN